MDHTLLSMHVCLWIRYLNTILYKYFDGLAQDCSNSIANTLGLMQPCAKDARRYIISISIAVLMCVILQTFLSVITEDLPVWLGITINNSDCDSDSTILDILDLRFWSLLGKTPDKLSGLSSRPRTRPAFAYGETSSISHTKSHP